MTATPNESIEPNSRCACPLGAKPGFEHAFYAWVFVSAALAHSNRYPKSNMAGAYEFAGRLLVPPEPLREAFQAAIQSTKPPATPTGWLPTKPRSTTSPRSAPKFGVSVEVFDAQRVRHGLTRIRPEKTPAK